MVDSRIGQHGALAVKIVTVQELDRVPVVTQHRHTEGVHVVDTLRRLRSAVELVLVSPIISIFPFLSDACSS